MEIIDPSRELFARSQDTAAWFAGVLEAGATCLIAATEYMDKGALRRKTLPILSIRTSYHPMIARLHSIYGGMNRPRFWHKGGRVAAEIVAETLPFTVARRDHALAMQNWLNAADVEEQIQIAQDLENKGWQGKAKPEDYAALVENPAFVAGVLDGRGSMHRRIAKYHHTLGIDTASKNLALLIALDAKFKGNARVHDPAGSEVSRESFAFTTKEDGHNWSIVGTSAISLVRFALPYLLTPPPADWDYQRSVEREWENHLLALKVATRARREMRLAAEYRLGQPSSITELAERFGINERRISRYLGATLSKDESKRRAFMVKQANRRNIDLVQTGKIARFIEQEVRAIQETGQGRVSTAEQLAELFGVKAEDVQSNVVPHVDPDLRAVRNRIFRSQNAQAGNRRRWHSQEN